jgi:integrase/recombinase XerD
MYTTTCNEEAVIKIIGKVTQEFEEFEDLQKQIKLRKLLDEALYSYDVITKETSLVASDIEDKMRIFFASKKLEGMSNKTLKNYNYILTKFAGFMRKPLSSITAMDMRMYLTYISKDLKPGSVNAILFCFKSFFSWLINEEYIYKNPMAKLKATKIPKRLRHALTEEELELLRQACKADREKALIEFLISTGCRLSEVTGVNIEDINWYEMSLNVIGKGNKERKVYFSTKAKILIKKYLENRKGKSPALFTSERRPYGRIGGRAVEDMIKKIADRAGFDKSIYPHLMRHSFATNNLNKGMNITTIQQLMGHESSSTTMIYAELSQENIKHEYRKTV